MVSDETRTGVTVDGEEQGSEPRPYLLVLTGSNQGEIVAIEGRIVIGRDVGATLRLRDDGVSRQHCAVQVLATGEVLVEDLGSRNGTYCNGERLQASTLPIGSQIVVGATVMRIVQREALEENVHRLMYEAALFDGLTRVFNRRHLVDRLRSEFAYAHRNQTGLALLVLDIDRFKAVNDTHGHPAGDAVLVAVAGAISAALRQEDVFGRLGGEEFLVIARGLARDKARALAERLRQLVARTPVVYGETTLTITTSIGVALYPDAPLSTSDELLAAADGALYAAKHNGRDRVEFHDAESGSEGTRPG